MAIRAPLTVAEKEWISQQKREGMTLQQIADLLDCSFFTVRKWWRFQRDHRAVRPRGRPAQGVLSTFAPEVRDQAVALKRTHPHWGPAPIRLELARQLGVVPQTLPSRARLAACFKTQCPESLQPRERRAYPERVPAKPKYPHHRWQVDAQEGLTLRDGEIVTLLDVRDPCGIMIGSHAFVTTSAKRWRKLGLREIQNALRHHFMHWGKPAQIQTDHESVYVGSSDKNFPSKFTLWLIGLGIEHVTSRPHRPTDQAQVERHHRTQADLVWRDESFVDVEELQRALDEGCQRYNDVFPVRAGQCQGQPPLRVYPSARSTGRPFDPTREWQLFDLARADTYLSQFTCTRQVTTTGVVVLGEQRYYVGRKFKGQRVSAQFLPEQRVFSFKTSAGVQITDLPARGLGKEDILGFVPVNIPAPTPFQIPLPWMGV